MCQANISKVVVTSLKDLAIGTSKGVAFVKDDLAMTQEPVMLQEKNITELSEYKPGEFVVGLWSESGYYLLSRYEQKAQQLKEPLWCNHLCTDLVRLPGYDVKAFPFYFAKTLRSISLIDFAAQQVHTLVELADMPTECYSYNKLVVSRTQDGRHRLVYVTQENQNTVVEEIVLANYFFKALEVSGGKNK